MEPRKPTVHEKQELAQYLMTDAGYEYDEIIGWIENSAVAVFEDYCTGSPGYVGKILMVVWEAAPTVFNVYVWNNGSIREAKQKVSS